MSQKRIHIVSIFVILWSARFALCEVTFYSHEGEWRGATSQVETFTFSPEAIVLADEVLQKPAPNADLDTSVLTFQSSNTGFSYDFRLTATSLDHTWNYQERRLTEFENTLSPGEVESTALHNDDVRIEFLSEAPLHAFGINILGNNVSAGPETELLLVFGLDGGLLDSVELPTTEIGTGSNFIGVVSDDPIGYLQVDEEASIDDVVYGDLMIASFVVPEPTSYNGLVFGVCVSLLLMRKHRLGNINRSAV